MLQYDEGGKRFIDSIALPGIDTSGGYDVEMDDLGGLPTMGADDYEGGSATRDAVYWEDEEEDLIDCNVPQYVPAVELYADAGGCPQHLSIVNYDEFAGNVAEEVSMGTHCYAPPR